MIRKTLLAGAVSLTLGTAAAPSYAQLFGGPCVTADGPCSGLADQVLQYARQALQLEQEAATAFQEAQNTIAVPFQVFQNAAGQIANILNIARQADLLVGNTGQFIANLSAGSYPIGPLNNPMSEIVKEQNAVALAIQTLGTMIDVENPQIASRATIISAINDQNMSADGRLKALQASGQLAAATGQQLHGIESIMLGMAQGQHASMLADQDRRAMQYKALDVLSRYTNDIPTGPGF